MVQQETANIPENNSNRHLWMLHALNNAATVLLVTDESNFEESLAQSMGIINDCVDVDRVYVWKNEVIDGELHYVNRYEWLRNGDGAGEGLIVRPRMRYSYNADPSWRDDRFERGECINGPLSSLSQGEQDMLGPYNVKSLLVIPVHLHGQFWGFVSYDDCHSERYFTETEVDVLRSTSLMMASVVSRIDQSFLLRDTHERTMLMLDSQPLCAILWNTDLSILDCNEEAVKLFKAQDKRDFINRFLTDLSPEFQPDGQRSEDKAYRAIKKTFEEGKTVFEWVHQTSDGIQIPAEVVLVRVVYESDFVVAGFVRDMSEQKRMLKEIEQWDYLLRTINRAADLLLEANEADFQKALEEGLGLLGQSTNVDAVLIWQNELRMDVLHYFLKFKWINDSGAVLRPFGYGMALPYNEGYHDSLESFFQGECLNGPVSILPTMTEKHFSSYGVKSILMIPLIIQEEFWGFISFYDFSGDRIFKHEVVDILRSAGLMMLTAINRMEQLVRVREADEHSKLMLNSTPLGCTLWDEDCNCIDCNEEALKLFGIADKQEFIHRFYELSPEFQPDGRKSVDEISRIVKQAMNEERYVFDWMHQLPDGTPVPSEVTTVRVKNGESYVVASYLRDLREFNQLVKKEEEAVLSMNKKMAVLDNIDTLIFVTDLDYNLIYINHNMAVAFGLDREACIGKKCHKAVRDNDEPCHWCKLPGLIPDKESMPTILDDYMWDETLGIWTESKSSIIRWVDDSLVHFHSINDRSVKKAYEDELRKAMEASIEASASKTTFLANMSHEIRTPMNSIIGFAELSRDIAISPKVREYLEKIIESAKWLLHIINDILDISKIESGKMDLQHAPFDLNDVVRSCQSLIQPAANERGLELQIHTEPLQDKMLVGDPVRLYQALVNLLFNSIKFTNKGSVNLTTYVRRMGGNAVSVYFEIKDTGIGMSEELIKKIFDPFVQADVSITRKYVGTGLGLPITKNIIEMMGGTLGVDSTPGVGTAFFFELAFSTLDASGDSVARKEYHIVKKPHFEGVVLLCEDNQLNREVICEHLSRVGLKTEIAENGKIGVEKVQDRIHKKEKPFDLIFMDMQMPVMDGLEAGARITELGTKTPIVILTANVMADDVELYEKSGMSDYLGKPFTTQELWRCLLKHLTPVSSTDFDENEQAKDEEILLKKMQVTFVRDNQTRFDEITNAINKDDIVLAHRLAHSLKSNAGMIGKTGLQLAAAQVEATLKEKDFHSLDGYLGMLKTELESALEELSYLQAEPAQAAVAKNLSTEQVLALFAELEPMLENINPESIDLIDDIRSIPGAEKLALDIEEYDFDAALETLALLKQKWL